MPINPTKAKLLQLYAEMKGREIGPEQAAPPKAEVDALTDATQAVAEFTGRLADLTHNIGPALAEIERLAAVLASFDDTYMDERLDPIREFVGAELHRLANEFDEGLGEGEIHRRKLVEAADLEALFAEMEAEIAAEND